MSNILEQAKDISAKLLELAELRSHLDVVPKGEILDMILTSESDAMVSGLVEALTLRADSIREEQKKLEGLTRTLAMEGSNQFNWVYYKPTCKFGWDDCIHDPAYIYSTYPDWYKELYGDKSVEDVVEDEEGCCRSCSEKCCYYDDEDK